MAARKKYSQEEKQWLSERFGYMCLDNLLREHVSVPLPGVWYLKAVSDMIPARLKSYVSVPLPGVWYLKVWPL